MSINIYQSNINEDFNPVRTNQAHESRTNKYKFQSSLEIKNKLLNSGFDFNGSSFAKTKDKTKAGFQKHIMVFSNNDLQIDDNNSLQLLVTNSHDGSSSLILNLGIFRAICANGLVVGDSLTEFRIRHQGEYFIEELQDMISRLVYLAPDYVKKIKAMQTISLTKEEQIRLAFDIANKRLDNNYIFANLEEMIKPVRSGDNKQDLWTVTNILQEKAIKGGIEFTNLRKDKVITTTSRKLTNFDKKKEVNKFIWDKADEFLMAA